MFHYLQTQMESYLEMMTVEKRKIRIWSKRAHLALRAYQVRGRGGGQIVQLVCVAELNRSKKLLLMEALRGL